MALQMSVLKWPPRSLFRVPVWVFSFTNSSFKANVLKLRYFSFCCFTGNDLILKVMKWREMWTVHTMDMEKERDLINFESLIFSQRVRRTQTPSYRSRDQWRFKESYSFLWTVKLFHRFVAFTGMAASFNYISGSIPLHVTSWKSNTTITFIIPKSNTAACTFCSKKMCNYIQIIKK